MQQRSRLLTRPVHVRLSELIPTTIVRWFGHSRRPRSRLCRHSWAGQPTTTVRTPATRRRRSTVYSHHGRRRPGRTPPAGGLRPHARVSAAHPDGIPSRVINAFTFEGRRLPLIVQPGIWKPAGLSAALTIRTTYTPPGQEPPYEDRVGTDGLVRYKWRGTDPEESDNRALREAMRQGRPLAYFHAVAKGVYQAFYPVYVVGEDPGQHEVLLDTVPAMQASASPLERAYAHRLTRHRLHQVLFRPRVLRAYGTRCALCRLRHAPLLDAAHILPDGHVRGD